MNGIFGEISTEVCGIAACDAVTGTGAAQIAPTVVVNRVPVTPNANAATVVPAGSCTITSSADHVYVNGAAVSAASGYTFAITSGSKVQVITQTGTQSPFITVLTCG